MRKGFKRLIFSVFFCFTSPVVMMQSFQNQAHPLFWPVFSVSLVLMALAVYLGVSGARMIYKELTND